jgi:phage-related protein
MAFDGTNNCWIPDVPYTDKEEWRLKIAKFGDGYQQRTLDGINALDKSWSLSWTNRKSSIVKNMMDYLANRKAAAFTFLDPATQEEWTVFCDDWTVSWNIRRRGGLYYGTLTAEFYKANGARII